MNIIPDFEKISVSPHETINLAKTLAEKITPGTIIALKGGLGTGKTTFTKGFAAGLGIKEPITSPTFTIVHEYDFEKQDTKKKLYHIDLYRLNSQEDAYDFGIDEILYDPNSIKIIEWPERLNIENFDCVFYEIKIEFIEGDNLVNSRKISLKRKENK